MSTEKLIAVAAGVLSILFTYLPALRAWYQKKDGVEKRQIMAVWLLIITVGVFAMSCVPALIPLATHIEILVACTAKSAYELIYLYLIAITVNQAVYLISPKHERHPDDNGFECGTPELAE